MAFRGNYCYDYPRPAVTTVCALFCQDENKGLSVLLIERGGELYISCWAFPGGFLEMDETVNEGAERELREETARPPLAFDHDQILKDAHKALQQ